MYPFQRRTEACSKMSELSDRDWSIRMHIYRFIIDTGRAPSVGAIAATFGIPVTDARQTLHRLERPHQIVLEPGGDEIRMAIPLSTFPTAHRVRIGDQCLYANCAWDSLGVAAMLHADAEIEAEAADSDEIIRYAIRDGNLDAPEGLGVQFPLPLRRWYDNIVDT